MSGKPAYYRGVRGSAALATAPLVDAPPAEALEPGEMRRVPFEGELLGAVRVRGGFATIPLDAFDRACEVLEAEEQAAYLHLLRLSVAQGRNWCRAAKRELMARLRLSERRLLRVLDALVTKGFARPLQRDNRGTLWRVYLPREAFGERLGDDVLVGRAGELRIVSSRAGTPTATRTPATTTVPTASATTTATRTATATATTTATTTATATATTERPRVPRAVPTEASLARALAVARGTTDPQGLADALREVRELVAEGQRPERIAAAIETVRRRGARREGGGEDA